MKFHSVEAVGLFLSRNSEPKQGSDCSEEAAGSGDCAVAGRALNSQGLRDQCLRVWQGSEVHC